MRKTGYALLFIFAFVGLRGSPLAADAMRESNYLHIDPSTAIVLEGFYPASSLKGRIINGAAVSAGTAFRKDSAGALALSIASPDFDKVALLFEEDICAIGFQIVLPRRETPNSIPVEVRFLARDGTVIDTILRQPALGTTRQAFSSEQFVFRFAGVDLGTLTKGEMAIGEVRALPCSLAIS